MKIWIDARKINENSSKWKFIEKMVKKINETKTDHDFIIYLSPNSKIQITNENITEKYVNLWFSFKDQYNFSKFLKQENIDNMLFFDIDKPLFYNKKYIVFPGSAMELFYPSKKTKTSLNKLKFNILYDLYLSKASKIITFTEKMREDFNDKLNIKYEKMEVFTPPLLDFCGENKEINVRLKYNIKNDYLLYLGNSKPQKNIHKILNSLKEAREEGKKLDLVLIWNKISNDYTLRDLAKNLWIERNILFLWEVPESELPSFFKASSAYIYPPFYEFFPFNLSFAYFFKTKIITSDFKEIKEIVWESWFYFSPLSEGDIKKKIIEATNSTAKINYEENKFSFDIKKLIKIIEEA